jgi:hypothetical protein
MGKYTITHTCGHTETYDMLGHVASRLERAGRMEATTCPACRAAANNTAADADGTLLPLLTGSDKQVAWALTIRQRALRSVDAFMVAHTGDAERLEIWQTLRAHLVEQRRAGWWIDRRDAGPQALVNEARRECYAHAAPVTPPAPHVAAMSTQDLEDSLFGED